MTKEIPSLSQGKPGENRGRKTKGASTKVMPASCQGFVALKVLRGVLWKERIHIYKGLVHSP